MTRTGLAVMAAVVMAFIAGEVRLDRHFINIPARREWS